MGLEVVFLGWYLVDGVENQSFDGMNRLMDGDLLLSLHVDGDKLCSTILLFYYMQVLH